MDMDVDKDASAVKNMEKKAIRKKFEAPAVLDLAEDGNQLNKVEKKKKKDKRKTKDNTEESRRREKGSHYRDMNVNKDAAGVVDSTIAMPDLVEDGHQYNKAEKKKSKDKRKPEIGPETSNDKIREKALSKEDDDNQNEKDKKKKRKNKKNSDIGSETDIAEMRGKDRYEANNNFQNENEKKKKKEKRLEKVHDDQLNVDIYDAEERNIGSQVNDGNVSKHGGERKEGKKKRRSKEEQREHEDDYVSTPTGVFKDKDKEGFEEFKEHGVSQKNREHQTGKKKKKKKDRRNNDEGGDIGKDESAYVGVDGKTNLSDGVVEEDGILLRAKSSQMDNGEQQTEMKKKKKRVREEADKPGKGESTAVEVGKMMNSDTNASEKVEKKRQREENKGKDLKGDEVKTHSTKKRSQGSEKEGNKMSDDMETNGVEGNSKDPKLKKKKKVSFSDHNEVFPLEGGIVQGKRFSPEEDEMVKQAVFDYIKAHDLGDEGLAMVLNCKFHPTVRNCWKEIGEALPHRPYKSVYDRAHNLFERAEERVWDSDEFEIIRKYHAKHGPKWKQLADAMGKHRRHLKDAWRRTKLLNRRKGHWSQDEYQKLFDLVNVDLRAKVNEEKKSKHGMLRDNISWTAIGDKFGTRNFVTCCGKWYNQLTSSMVREGEWADTDDYRLIDALYTLDACCIEDVDWDSLLEHRSGDLCRKRWNQMANHIGEHGKKSFAEQVEILSKRYCPELLEARETWDSKSVIP